MESKTTSRDVYIVIQCKANKQGKEENEDDKITKFGVTPHINGCNWLTLPHTRKAKKFSEKKG